MASAPRKVPVHRPSVPRGGSTARPASHPGIGGGGANGPGFVSPYQPPPSYEDFLADVEAAEAGWITVTAAGRAWRMKVPKAQAVHVLTLGTDKKLTSQGRLNAVRRFLAHHLHPDDFTALVLGLAEDTYSVDDLMQVTDAILMYGTARPKARPSVWRAR